VYVVTKIQKLKT